MINRLKKKRQQLRVRKKLASNTKLLRLCVFRSNRYMYAQIIDDSKNNTVVAVSEKHLPVANKVKKSERARQLGIFLAKKAIEKKIKEVVFDRGNYVYHGRVKALADGAREGGLKF